MKKWYKIVFRLNGNLSCSVFHYSSPAELKHKLKLWKDEHVTPYNRIKIETFGEDILKPESRKDIYLLNDDGN